MSASDLEEGGLSVGWEVLLLLLEDVDGLVALLSEELELELESRRFFFFLLFLLKHYKKVVKLFKIQSLYSKTK